MEQHAHTLPPYFAESAGADALALAIVCALQQGHRDQARHWARLLTLVFPHLPEGHALYAATLMQGEGKGKAPVSALDAWHLAFRNTVPQPLLLAQALRVAWSAEHKDYAAAWQTLVERTFVLPPPVDLLAQLTAQGWKGCGSIGIHLGKLCGWIWLPKKESPRWHRAVPGEARVPFTPTTLHTEPLGKRVLHVFATDIPPCATFSMFSLTSSGGQHALGSPLAFAPRRQAATQRVRRRHNKAQTKRVIPVIIPVYDDRAATLRCLGSLMASRRACTTSFDIVAVWDHGPDAQLLEDLRRLQSQGRIILHHTPAPSGFVCAINYALDFYPGRDVVLLNADTLVVGNWLDRLKEVASLPHVATVTPMTSFGEELSFPRRDAPAAVRTLRQVHRYDRACQKAAGRNTAQPIYTGVGFCFFITRAALEAVGTLDSTLVQGGYGEEVDFCLRAAHHGLRNMAALHVFVAHLGGRSFGSRKQALVTQNNAAICIRHPQYHTAFDQWQRSNALCPHRQAISQQLLLSLDRPLSGPLHVYCTADVLPLGIRTLAQGAGPWAALCVHPGAHYVYLHVRLEDGLWLEDMPFDLPAEAQNLRKLLQQWCSLNAITHGPSPAVHRLVESLNLVPCQAMPAPDLSEYWPKDNHAGSGHAIVPAPRSLPAWQALCATARSNGNTIYWVFGLEKLWGKAPRPANMRACAPSALEAACA